MIFLIVVIIYNVCITTLDIITIKLFYKHVWTLTVWRNSFLLYLPIIVMNKIMNKNFFI